MQYSDIGCHLNIKGLNRLKEYTSLCSKKGILTFQYKLPKQKKLKSIKNIRFQRYFSMNIQKWIYLNS